MKRNVFGKRVKGEKILLDCVHLKDDGNIDWDYYAVDSDERGFSKNHEIEYNIILPKGFKIARFGDPDGKFSTIPGTDYNSLSLPYLKESVEYHEYVIKSDTIVSVVVDKGKVARNFLKAGGAIQFFHHESLSDSIKNKSIKEVYGWLLRQKLKTLLK